MSLEKREKGLNYRRQRDMASQDPLFLLGTQVFSRKKLEFLKLKYEEEVSALTQQLVD